MVLNPLWIAGGFTTADWSAESNQAAADFGFAVSSGGDVNGDGFADVIVGSPYYDEGGTDQGKAFVYLGSASGLASTPGWTATNEALAWFGVAVAGGGDVNADGFDDVLVTSSWFDLAGQASVFHGSTTGPSPEPSWAVMGEQSYAQFGSSGAIAGDVNGDGFDDVVVSALAYSGAQGGEGKAYLYQGSSAGLSLTAEWTADPTNQVSAAFGWNVGAAGDVNGDGFADVIVGAALFDGGEPNQGRAYVYLGSAIGLDADAAWIKDGNQDTGDFAYWVTSAGDVNADGFDDVIIGEPFFDGPSLNEGRALLYLGSATGLGTVAAWTAEANSMTSSMGLAVSSAGDVNNDGYSDVVVGCPTCNGSIPNEGTAQVFLGSAVGLDAVPARTLVGGQADAYFGSAVAKAGDVNGDEFDDIVVGARLYDNGQDFEGAAFLFEGSCDDIGDECDPCAEPESVDADQDGFCAPDDCDDENPAVYPDAEELCDGLDNACQGYVSSDELDEDGDGERVCDGDCDDADAASNTSASETCNGLDDDCDGAPSSDELDQDNDQVAVCDGDCDDFSARRSPELTEVCGDGIDNDCDGEVDQDCVADEKASAGCSCTSAGGAAGAPLLAFGLLMLGYGSWSRSPRKSSHVRRHNREGAPAAHSATRSSRLV